MRQEVKRNSVCCNKCIAKTLTDVRVVWMTGLGGEHYRIRD
jgi:hypothetical protein